MPVPATVQAILAARIDRLPLEEKWLLQTTAAIGTDVLLPLLQAIAELPEATLHRSLAHLQTAEFLYETSLFPEQVYTFKHALTHEVAYGSLLQERRRLLHGRIVAALEQRHADRLAEQVEPLALHAFRGAVWDKAVTYGQQAGARAADRAAFRYSAWLSAVCLLEGCLDEARQHARQALALARQYGERGHEAFALYQLGAVHAHAEPPDVAQAAAHYQQALTLANELGMRPLQAHCHHALGTLYAKVGQRAQARTALARAIEMYRAMDMTFWLPQAEATLTQMG
jgi:predicted ATPase